MKIDIPILITRVKTVILIQNTSGSHSASQFGQVVTFATIWTLVYIWLTLHPSCTSAFDCITKRIPTPEVNVQILSSPPNDPGYCEII
ncbi:Hypothetical predicted protein [Octopus vulgaris]|uniref:Uncharacterized protein n=1 Tax=Octopus vulgaris TaxID=6645 RepID=A0AA36ATD2_OCTVU|nr:Hypothetical predicted protein [Octopus vulgaris]